MSDASKALPGVEVEFGDPKKKRTLKYNLYSFCRIEEVTGKNPMTGEVFTNLRAKDVAALVWAGLLHEDKNLSLESVMEEITLADFKTVSEAVRRAFEQASPEASEKKTSSDTPEAQATSSTG